MFKKTVFFILVVFGLFLGAAGVALAAEERKGRRKGCHPT